MIKVAYDFDCDGVFIDAADPRIMSNWRILDRDESAIFDMSRAEFERIYFPRMSAHSRKYWQTEGYFHGRAIRP